MKNYWIYKIFNKRIKTYLLSAVVFFFICSSTVAQNKLPEKVILKLGNMNYAYREMSASDIDATLKIYMDTFRKRFLKKGIKKIEIEYKSYNKFSELERDLKSDKLNVFTVSSIDFFKLENRENYTPLLIGAISSTTKFEKYILISNSKTNDLKQLMDKEIHVSSVVPSEIKKMWAETVFYETNKVKKIKKVKFNDNPSSESNLVLAVFFNKFDYALITKSVFDLVCELNPQVNEKIKILAESPDLVNTLFGYKNGMDENVISTLLSVGEDLRAEPDGKQILNLFKIDRMFGLTIEEMKPTESLINKHNALFKKK